MRLGNSCLLQSILCLVLIVDKTPLEWPILEVFDGFKTGTARWHRGCLKFD
jgi:hypothetical protein